jgi:hypothetical protein
MTVRTPELIVPVTAASVRELRGRRLLIGLPGLGWRGDLRGDAPVVQGSRTYVPVLTEQEWYRAETEQVEVFAPLVPIERVWVETLGPRSDAPLAGDVLSRLVSLDAPPVRRPVPARDCPALTGRRLVRARTGGEPSAPDRRDLRAVTEVYANNAGDLTVRAADEVDWYRWAWSGKAPRTLEISIDELWAE